MPFKKDTLAAGGNSGESCYRRRGENCCGPVAGKIYFGPLSQAMAHSGYTTTKQGPKTLVSRIRNIKKAQNSGFWAFVQACSVIGGGQMQQAYLLPALLLATCV
jgi:hypothetical protein